MLHSRLILIVFSLTIFTIQIKADLIGSGTDLACQNTTCRYGECEQQLYNYTCHCFTGIKGFSCDRLLTQGDNLCLSNPCWNGGTCQNLGNDWACTCPPGKSGKDCKIVDSSPCLFNNPCQNNAVCRVDNNNGFFCFCIGDFYGQFCENQTPLCERRLNCYNGGTCDFVSQKCVCAKNFTGTFCETFSQDTSDKTIRIYCSGAYIADVVVNYELPNGLVSIAKQQKRSLLVYQDYIFRIPWFVDYESGNGCTVTVKAVGGIDIFSIKMHAHDECYDVWGTTLDPKWASSAPCH